MLKALELIGFKSFADRTRFVFPEGITVVVGPNGSGKSNIVDAMKWVLGAQSAKSLRGADMADIIFKGSAAGGRKPANSAEATLIFDNSSGVLGIDSPEVLITRRVYRSGESEYLINRSPCRLKDIKDLFRGTGVGVDAYSLIEQGKVDRMLQASPKDRRAIFEEAAGISRFKVKRVEALRRLERANQDLTRLKDIVEEIRYRYETLRHQAEKATRYREMVQRLHVLRCQIGLREQSQWENKKNQQLEKLEQLEAEQLQGKSALEEAQSQSQQFELQLQDLAEQAQRSQDIQSSYKHDIALLTGQNEQLRQTLLELHDGHAMLVERLESLRQRAVLTAEEAEIQRQALRDLEGQFECASELITRLQLERDAIAASRSEAIQTTQALRSEHNACLRAIMELEQRRHQGNHRIEEWNEQVQSLRSRWGQAQHAAQVLVDEHAQQNFVLSKLQEESETAQRDWATRLEQLESVRQSLRNLQSEAIQLQGKRETAKDRFNLLQLWEQQLEGVGLGARQMIAMAHENTSPPWNSIRGLVADLIEVDLSLAPLIDVALGGMSETIVLHDGSLIDYLTEGEIPIEGRVSLLRLDRLCSRKSGEKIQLDGLRGVLGRADRLVRFQAEYDSLIRFLLGTTWLVDSLPTALDLSHLRGSGLRFVTTSCELIDSDGTLTYGTLHSSVGIVSRRSELQQCKEEVERLDAMIQAHAQSALLVQQQQSKLEMEVELLDPQAKEAARRYLEGSVQLRALEEKIAQNAVERERLESASFELTERMESSKLAQLELDQELDQANEQGKLLESKLASALADQVTLDQEWNQIGEEVTAQRIQLARLEQRMEDIRVSVEQLSRDQHERSAAVLETEQQLQFNLQRQQRTEQTILENTERTSTIQSSLEQISDRLVEMASQIQELRTSRQHAQKQTDILQRQHDRIRDRYVQVESELRFTEASLQQLRTRYWEDYQIQLTDEQLLQDSPPLDPEIDADALASQLKLEISQVGDVNMEALRELDELQARYESLQAHYDDLCASRDDILKIISKISQESRRIFNETLEAIRINFQQLYRKSFGGGSADLVLEEGDDELECGVEILATPPGKTAFSNSLLSGGEKALTAVALIMAIFQFRPSPFCVLDEVDAPFDEANIGRFVTVLKEFLHSTKFIVVTHSKKTMTAADTLYGVTMQENGVSKQVSVRFEDVGDNGEILSDGTNPSRSRAA